VGFSLGSIALPALLGQDLTRIVGRSPVRMVVILYGNAAVGLPERPVAGQAELAPGRKSASPMELVR
jgi:hypothetical protein